MQRRSALTPDRDALGSGGLFIRYTGAPDVFYRLRRAASVTGPWSSLATNTAPAFRLRSSLKGRSGAMWG